MNQLKRSEYRSYPPIALAPAGHLHSEDIMAVIAWEILSGRKNLPDQQVNQEAIQRLPHKYGPVNKPARNVSFME